MITVTKPFLPPREDYDKYLDGIWERNWLTNSGPLVNKLESQLKEYLDLEHLIYVSNGTIALQMAIKALKLTGEIITTPFSYVATTSTIIWENCTPIFVDIDSSLNIDPTKIEAAITPNTKGIMATHVFGNPCALDEIQQIAEKHNLKVIYDAAHAFGVKYKDKSIFEYGDISTSSFHATKLYHTIEGGIVTAKKSDDLKRVSLMKSFGHTSATTFDGIGINGKNSEFHAAMGLCNLKYIQEILDKRKALTAYYDKQLESLNLQRQKIDENCFYNHAYYPIILESEEKLLKAMNELKSHQIFPRRYFYPSLNNLPYVQSTSCPVSEDVAQRILCLPFYHSLKQEEQDMVCKILIRSQKY
jgi:dTDP-4-amino-4,6-dideoxygalactose transaminase